MPGGPVRMRRNTARNAMGRGFDGVHNLPEIDCGRTAASRGAQNAKHSIDIVDDSRTVVSMCPVTQMFAAKRSPTGTEQRTVPVKISMRAGVTELLLPGCLLLVYAWYLMRTGLPGKVIHEAGDSAGDMLQVSRALERRWYVTGHHSDVGVHHPGPFGLWLKTVASVLHDAGIGGSVYAMVMSMFVGLRLTAVAITGYLFRKITGSKLSGWAAALGAAAAVGMMEGYFSKLDMNGSVIHFLSPWAVLVLLTGALALACGRGGPNFLIAASGVAAHLHTPSFPLGITALLLGAGALIIRRGDALARRSGIALMALFVVPFGVRVFAEPGFPLNYIEAARYRREIAGTANGSTGLDKLVAYSGLPLWALSAALLLPVLLAVPFLRRNPFASLALAAGTFWAAATIVASPAQKIVGTELVWISGVIIFAWSAAGAGIVMLATRLMQKVPVSERLQGVTRDVGGWVIGAALLALTTLTVNGILPENLSTGGGVDGQHVSVMADSVVERSGGKPFALVLDEPTWLSSSSGVLLELERRNEIFCIITNLPRSALDTFIGEGTYCEEGVTLPAFVVTWDTGGGEWFVNSESVFSGGDTTPYPLEAALLCWRGADGAVCPKRISGDVETLMVHKQDPSTAYGNVHPLRLLVFSCTVDDRAMCRQLVEQQ